jgi:RNA polymerase sigma-70 factor (ECF subfamily)
VLFDQSWAYAVLDGANRRLEADYTRRGRAALLAELRGFLASHRSDESYADAAQRLRMTDAALRQSIRQMRKRYRAMLEAEVADTVASVAEVQEELGHLQAVLAGVG